MMNNGGDEGAWIPERSSIFPLIPHYWGDAARQLMLGAVALMLVTAPLYGDSLRTELPYEITGAVVVVAFAALTNPLKRSIIIVDIVLAGTGAIAFGTWALWEYGQINTLAFVLRDAIGILFLFAFYFSLKTCRAMMLGQIGQGDIPRHLPGHSRPHHESEEDIASDYTD